MLKFISDKRQLPETREVRERRQDFEEISKDFAEPSFKLQADRCSQCGVPFCQSGCPLHNNIPDWLSLVSEGRHQEAYELASATNNMPEICGRICPQDRLCEQACVLELSDHGAVTIGAVEKQIGDRAWAEGWVKPLVVKQELQQSVGIVGSGPAGLAAAEELRLKGYQVHVYERQDRIGGLLVYGIPNFKLDKKVVSSRVDRLISGGVQFHASVEIGKQLSWNDLRQRHQSVLLATGVYRPRGLGAEFEQMNSRNVVEALDYLIACNRRGFGDPTSEEQERFNAQGKNVVVIGGGDTAMDCVRSAVRQGAQRVSCVYRRDRENMPGSQREVQYAEQEGVQFCWLSQPLSFEPGGDGVSAVRLQRMRLASPDSQGRRRPQAILGSEYSVKAELVIKALGFDAEDLPQCFGCPELVVSSAGTLKVDKNLQTTVAGVFAAGDIVRGASLVVWAIRDGREASASIDRYLRQLRDRPSGVAAKEITLGL